MSAHLERGQLLFQQGRYADAERELRQAVLDEPQNPIPHALLALTSIERTNFDAAELEANEAIRCGPDLSFAHYVRGRVLVARNRFGEAEEAVREALRLDPTDADVHALLALIRVNRRDYRGARAAAENGLAYDPGHAGCSTARTMALVQLGESAGALEESAAALARRPHDDYAHASRGWAFLNASQPKEALPAFREALRIDPTNGYAREGMMEALKGQYWLYRQMLKFLLWMGRRSAGEQVGVIIGLILIQRVLGSLAKQDSGLQPLFLVLLFGCAGFILFSLAARPIFNLVLMTNRFGRQVLTRAEKWQGAIIGVWLAMIAVGIVHNLCTENLESLYGIVIASSFALTVLPLTSAMRFEGRRRWIMIGLTVVMLGLGAGQLVCVGKANWAFHEAVASEERGKLVRDGRQIKLETPETDRKIEAMKGHLNDSRTLHDWLIGLTFLSMILANSMVFLPQQR